MTPPTIHFLTTSHALPGFTFRLAFAVTIALLCALLASALARRLSAAVRHKIWSLGIVTSLLIPATLLVLPARHLGLIGSTDLAMQSDQFASVESEEAPPMFTSTSPAFADENPNPPAPKTAISLSDSNSLVAPSSSSSTSKPERALHLTLWLAIAWSIPALLLIARLLWGAIASHAIVRRAATINLAEDDPTLIAQLREHTAPRHSVAHPLPSILQSNEIQSPLCVGWFRSTILLPSNWREWSRDQLHAVLTHELAHVGRRDVLWQAIARLTCALYWLHPLAWYAARQMRIERELACDDWVVRGSHSPTQYARWLLNLACELKATRALEQLGVAMAGQNGLKTRVEAALDPSRKRSPLSRTISLLLTSLAAILLILAGTLSPLKAVQTPANESGTQQASTKDAQKTPPLNAPTTSAQPTASSDDQQIHLVMGQVLDESGKGVAGARVTVPPSPPYPATHTASADADGRFVLTIEPRKVMRLTLFAESRDGKLQSLVTLPRNGQNTEGKFSNVRLELKGASEFPITVVDAANHPVAGVQIIAGLIQLQTTSDANGKATLRLPAGQSPGFILARKDNVGLDYVLFARTNAPRVDPSRLAPNFVGPVHFVLNGMRTVAVTVVDDKSRPLAGVKLNPRFLEKAGKAELSLSSRMPGGTVETDPAGTAQLSVPADVDKPVRIYAELGGYFQSNASSWNPKAPSNEVKVVLFQEPTFHLSVVDVDGKPAGGAQIMIVDDHGSQNYGIFSNGRIGPDGASDGMLLPNTYYMFAAMKDQTASDPVMQISKPGGPPIQIELKLKPAVHVHGQLTAGNPSKPVADGSIHIQFDDNDSYKKLPPDQRLPESAVGPRGPHPAVMFNRPTDDQGNFEFYLAPGTYHFIDPNEIATTLLKGQTFTVSPNDIALKIDVHYKTTQRVRAR